MTRQIFITIICLSAVTTRAQSSAIELLGDGFMIALPASATMATLLDHDGWQDTRSFAGSYIWTRSATIILKLAVNQPRPDGGSYGFPSGHTSVAFQSAVWIQREYGYKWGIPAIALASFVGYSRVYANRHDWGDVLAGAALGSLFGVLFTPDSQHDLQGCMYMQNKTCMIGLSWQPDL